MTGKDLITKISEESGLTKKDSELALTAFINIVSDTLKRGDRIQLIGFGTFEVKERAARIGRNPHDGRTIEIPASKSPKFKPSKTLKAIVNGGE